MATNNNNNDFAQLSQQFKICLSASEAIEGEEPNPGPHPNDPAVLAATLVRQCQERFCRVDVVYKFDLNEPADDESMQLVSEFYDYTYQLRQLRSDLENSVDVSVFELHTVLSEANTFITLFEAALDEGRVVFYFDTDDDDDEYTTEPPPLDLTKEGIEPNPGPNPRGARNNRSSSPPQVTKAERKRLKAEQKAYMELLRRSARDNVKFSQFLVDNDNYAQIGGHATNAETNCMINNEAPPPPCERCHKTKCDCMIKRFAAKPTAMEVGVCFSVVVSIIKLIESIMSFSGGTAQIGFFNLFVSEQTNSLVDNLNERLEGIPNAETITSLITNKIEDVLSSNCGMLPISVRTVLRALLSLVAIFTLIQLGIVTYKVASLIATIALSGCDRLSNLMSHMDMWSSGSVAQIGAFANESEMLASLSKVLPKSIAFFFSSCVVYLVSKIPGRDNSPEGWMRKVSMFPRTCSSMSEIFKYTMESVNKAWSYFQIVVLGCDPDIVKEAVPDITNWMVNVETNMVQANLDNACRVKSKRMQIARLYQEGHALMLKYHDALTPEYRLAMQRMMIQAAKLKSHVEGKFPEFKAVRNVPLAIWLVGESQIGKSRLQSLIATELCLSVGLDDCKDQIYQRCVEQEYWDGYNNQFVVIMDDFGQMRDTVSQPNLEFFEIIRSVGPFPYPLHMADLSAKNSTMFTSGVLMMSTNALNMNIESLTYPDAVWNRLNAQSWSVLVKPKYVTMKSENNGREYVTLNLEAVKADSPKLANGKSWEINPYIYEFVRFDARRRDPRSLQDGQRYEWDEFIEVLKKDLRDREGGGAALDGFLDDYISEQKTKSVAQMGLSSHDIRGVFVAQGPGEQIVDPYTLGQFLDWLNDYKDIDNPEGPISSLYRVYSVHERAEYDGDVYKQSLLAYIPNTIPDDMFSLLLIAFFKEETSFGKSVRRKMEFCAATLKCHMEGVPARISEFIASVKSLCKSLCAKMYSFASSDVGKIALVMGTGLLFTAFNVYTSHHRQESSAESDTRNLQPRLRAHVRNIAKAKPKVMKAEMGQSMGQLDVIAKVRRQQYLLLGVYDDASVRNFGTITNIVGQIFLMPAHFYTYFQHRKPVEVRLIHCDSTKVEIRKPFNEFFGTVVALDGDGANNDAIVFSIPNFIRGKNVISHFVSKDEIAKLYDRKVYVTLSGLDYEEKNNTVVSSSISGRADLLVDQIHTYGLELHNKTLPITACSVASYTIPTKAGDCGKILSANCDSLSGRVIGIHVSGSTAGFNFAQIVLREELLDAVALFPAIAQCARGMPKVVENEGVPLDTGVIHLGKLPEHLPQSSRTTIIPSRMHGMLSDPITKPALLVPKVICKDGEEVLWDPLVEGAKKAGRTCGFVESHVLDAAARDVLNICRTKFKEGAPDVVKIDYETAVRGIEGDELFQPINRTTSPGYPYVLQKKVRSQKGKTNWMGREEWEFDTDEAKRLREDVEKMERDCANSRPIDVVWIDTLKDERRPLEKADQGNTRIISNGPMHFNILFRMYFMSALAFLRHNRVFNGIAVGINVWDREWDHLARWLQANSTRFIDGDFKNFDGTLMDQFMWKIFWILDSMYDDACHTIRYNLWYQVVYAIRVCRGTVYQCTHSLPSGFVATAEVNSLFVNLVFRCAYLILAGVKCPEERSMRSFNENVRMVAYGDDNVLSIKPKIISWFNMESLVSVMKTFGMEYTAADKSSVIVNNKSLSEISFLKRGFKRVDSLFGDTSVFLCPAELSTRLEMLNWTRKRPFDSNPEESDVVSEVIKEIAMHGKAVYDEYVPQIVDAAHKAGVTGFRDEGLFHYHHQIISGSK